MPSRSRRALPLVTIGLALAFVAPASAAIEPGALSADGRVRAFSAALAGSGVLTGVQVADRVAGSTQDISVDERGQWVRGSQPDIDFSGRVVAFSSDAALRLDDANGANDIYVRDRACPVAERASLGVGGAAADGPSTAPAISGDGRWVAFVSEATNLVPGDTDGSADVFVADRATGAIVRASVAADGRQGAGAWLGSSGGPPALSADGRVVAFATLARLTADDRDNTADVYARDLAAGGIERVPVNAERWVVKPALSADGRFVVVGEADGADIWRHDRATGRTDRMNTWPSGVGAGFEPAISADGTRVVFVGDPDPLYWPDEHGATELWARDVGAGTTTRVRPAASPAGPQWAPGISADGRWVSWAARDVVGGVHDLGAGTELPVPGVEPVEGVCATPPPPGSAVRAIGPRRRPGRLLAAGRRAGRPRGPRRDAGSRRRAPWRGPAERAGRTHGRHGHGDRSRWSRASADRAGLRVRRPGAVHARGVGVAARAREPDAPDLLQRDRRDRLQRQSWLPPGRA